MCINNRILERWAQINKLSVEWVSVQRPAIVEAIRKSGYADGVIDARVRNGNNEGRVIELFCHGTLIVRVKLFESWDGAWVVAGRMAAALSEASRKSGNRKRMKAVA